MSDHERIDEIERIMDHMHTGRCMDNPGGCECGVDRFWGRIESHAQTPKEYGSIEHPFSATPNAAISHAISWIHELKDRLASLEVEHNGLDESVTRIEKASKEHYISTHDIALEQEEMGTRLDALEASPRTGPTEVAGVIADLIDEAGNGTSDACIRGRKAILLLDEASIEPTDEEWQGVLEESIIWSQFKNCKAVNTDATEEALAKQVVAERKRADEYRSGLISVTQAKKEEVDSLKKAVERRRQLADTWETEHAKRVSERDASYADVDRLKKRLCKTAQIIIECIGATGPENAEDAAIRIVAEVERLKEKDAKPLSADEHPPSLRLRITGQADRISLLEGLLLDALKNAEDNPHSSSTYRDARRIRKKAFGDDA